MGTKRSACALAGLAVVLAVGPSAVDGAFAQSAAQLNALDAALERRDPYDAPRRLDAVAAARRSPDGALRIDPLLSGYFGRYYLHQGGASAAIPYLERADGTGFPDAQRVEARFALAEAYDLTGSPDSAARVLERLGRETLTADQQQRLALALAARELIADPAAALRRVSALDAANDPGVRFEAEWLAARAWSLLGDIPAAGEAAGRAWSAAVSQPSHRLAPIRSALMLASLASETGDRDRLLAMLNVVRASEVIIEPRIAAYLPVCGEDGIGQDDRVTFAVYGDWDWQRLVPVSVSRLSAVAPFVRALVGRRILSQWTAAPAGTLIAVRCRSVPSESWRAVPAADPAVRVYAENGVYLPVQSEWDAGRVSALEQSIAELEARHGAEHPGLVPLLYELAQRVGERVHALGGDPASLRGMNERLSRATRRLPGAQQPMFPTEEELGGMAAAGPDPARAMEVARTMMVMRVGRLDFEPAFDLAQVLIEDMDGEDQTIERPLVEALLARAGDRPHDPRRRALLMRLGEIQTEAGDFAGGIASYRAAGAADGTCLIAHNGVAFAGGEISSDSYPDWAARYGAAGRTTIEFGIDAQGRVANQRVIFSAPGGLFDGVATEAFGASARYLPRREGARPRSCGGNMVTIHWRMADEEEEEGEEKVVDFDPFAPDSI